MSKINFFSIILIICLLTACAPKASTPVATGTAQQPAPSSTAVQSTNTPDPHQLIGEATLLGEDFENGYPPELYDASQKWRVQTESSGNSIFCNQVSDQWSPVVFGLDQWADYAVSLRIKFVSTSESQEAEIYIRINGSIEGYRANIWHKQWAGLSYYPPSADLGGSTVSIRPGQWFQVQVQAVSRDLKYFLNDRLVAAGSDDKRTTGWAGFGAAPNTSVCVDDILVWGLDKKGDPLRNTAGLLVKPSAARFYTIDEKLANRPTIPVFFPWPEWNNYCGRLMNFDCDTVSTPYSIVWTQAGVSRNLESTQAEVSQAQTLLMRSDRDTLYLVSEEWLYYTPPWRSFPDGSIFYLDEAFSPAANTEYAGLQLINFLSPEWPAVLAKKALSFQHAGFDGMMLDWWHDDGIGRDATQVRSARMAIAKAIRDQVGSDFVLMAIENWNLNDPTEQYLSGVFLELWKERPSDAYPLRYSDEPTSRWDPSIERMEDVLKYWNTHLQWPKVIAFEPWKITTGDYIADRNTPQNYSYAKLFAAMALVIPDNGYMLYADNNGDWGGGDHQHAYYDFYHTDLGKPTSGIVTVENGVAYKQFEEGIVAYNRTKTAVELTLPDGKKCKIGPLEGLFLEIY